MMRDVQALPLAAVLAALLTACGSDSEPEPSAECGNLIVEEGEQCDAGPFGSSTCTNQCTFPAPEDEDCGDGDDNDQDGDTDCDDSDCTDDPACLPDPEVCDDGVDNDEDGDTDCDDSDCDGDEEACPTPEDEICDDRVDNDLDGDTDCRDDDCLGNAACPEICDDELDNNGDGWIDCLDETCAGDRDCPATCGDRRVDSGEQCDDGPANADEPDACRTNCREPRCGDGIQDSDEACDSGSSIGSPGVCWRGCVIAPTATGCGDTPLLDMSELATNTATGGFSFVTNTSGETPADNLSAPATCSNKSGFDLLLHFVPERDGTYVISTDNTTTSADTILTVYDGLSCEADPVACADDTFQSTKSTVFAEGVAGEPMMIGLEATEWRRVRVTAERVGAVSGAGEPCTPGAFDRVCGPGLQCVDGAAAVCAPYAGSCDVVDDLTDRVHGNISTTVTTNTSFFGNNTSGSCGGDDTPEYVAQVSGRDEPILLQVTPISPEGSAVYIQSSCGDDESEVLCSTEAEAVRTQLDPDETVFIGVEGADALGGFASFEVRRISVLDEGASCDRTGATNACIEPFFCSGFTGRCERHLGTTCENPFDINRFGEPAEVGSYLTWELDTTERNDDLDITCGFGLGGDLVGRYVPTQDGILEVIATAASDAPQISVTTTCGSTSGELACAAEGGNSNTIYLPMTAGEPLLIVAEAPSLETEGPATITVREVPPLGFGGVCDVDGVTSVCQDTLTCVPTDRGGSCRFTSLGSCADPLTAPSAIGAVDTDVFISAGEGLDYASLCGNYGDTVVALTAQFTGVMTLSLETPSDRRDATLAVRTECADPESETLCRRDPVQGVPYAEQRVTAGETVYVHVASVTEARLRARVLIENGPGESCDPSGTASRCEEGYTCDGGTCRVDIVGTCESPLDLLLGEGDMYIDRIRTEFNTGEIGTTDAVQGICGGTGGAQTFAEFVAPVDGTATVRWTARDLIGVLHVPAGGCPFSPSAQCGASPGVNQPISRDFEMTAGQRLLLVLDANRSGAGVTTTDGGAQVTFAASGTASCSDFVQNNGETDIDCGGPFCGPCDAQQGCFYRGDCVSGDCVDGTCSYALTCFDRLQTAGETDVDCGGDCVPCADNRDCVADRDCFSGICSAGTCQAASCDDGRRSGTESGVDCGGPVCDGCRGGQLCNEGSDCITGQCVLSGGIQTCTEPDPTCDDGILNGDEVGVDCGGICGGEPCVLECEPGTEWVDMNDFEVDGEWVLKDTGGSVRLPLTGDGIFEAITPDCTEQTDLVNEVAHRFEVPVSGTYGFTTDVPGAAAIADTILYIRDLQCRADAAEIACHDDIGPLNKRSEVRVPLEAGDVVFAIVDTGDASDAGQSYALRIFRVTP